MSVNSFDDYPMSWRPDLTGSKGPKYRALAELLEQDIKSGALKAGTKLPPQRELADFLNINLSTVSRAFKICEERGLLSASVGSGTFVASGATTDPVLLFGSGDDQIIEMGAIVPDVAGSAKVRKYMERLLKTPDALELFSYCTPEGTSRHRSAGAAWLERSGFHTTKDHIVLAAGGQNALTAALGTFFERGDKVGTDPVTYPGIKSAAKMLGIHLIPVQGENCEMREAGIRYAVQNENIKGLYVIPDYHNPTAHIMSLEGRRTIARLAREEKLLVIEDGLNNLLEEKPLPPIASFAPDDIVYLSSLSKTICPGLRTAFVHVPDRYRQELITTLYSMNISVSPLLATVSAGLIEDGTADEIIEERKKEIRRRNLFLDEMLADFATDGDPGSPLRCLHLPEPFTGRSFELRAREAGVQVYGAERFAIGNRPAPRMARLAVTSPPSMEKFSEGVARLKKVLTSKNL